MESSYVLTSEQYLYVKRDVRAILDCSVAHGPESEINLNRIPTFIT